MNKFTSLIVSATVMAGTTVSAAPFLAIGDSAELFLTGTVGVRFSDNVTLSSNAIEDVVFEVTPGFALEFGKNALTSGSFSYQEAISRYVDTSNLDSELSSVRFNANYDNGKTQVGVNASYEELNQNTPTLQNPNDGELSPRDVITVGGDGEFEVSQKSSMSVGLTYVDTAYEQTAFTDSEIATVPLKYYFELTPKVDASVGFRYRNSDLSNSNGTPAIDSEDFFYSVGARGDFTPKLKGSFSVGLTDRQNDGGPDRSTLGLDSSLDYLWSEKTTFNAAISNDFGSSGQGESQENSSISLGVRVQVWPELSLNSKATYRKIDYFNKPADDYYEFTLGGEYTLNEYVTFTSGAVYKDNKSGLGASGDFDNTEFSFAARIRY